MPIISLFHNDFESLIGQPSTIDQIEAWLPLVKGELKNYTLETGEIRVELQDSNRPDLWCVEGIARQIRIKIQEGPIFYPFLQTTSRPKRKITVATGLEEVRPFVAACSATGYHVTKEGLTQLIQVQEKLADIYGRKRQTVSIGLYGLPNIHFPVTYGLAKPDAVRFIPLGCLEPLTLNEILTVHPKGIEYRSIVADHPKLPLLWDTEGQILSFPPIINSREIGEVQVGDSDLLVEVTGTDLRMVLLTLNIFAANLADRGAVIEPIEIVYPYATEWGNTLSTPYDMSEVHNIPLHAIEEALGLSMGVNTIQQALTAYGYQVQASLQTLAVRLPSYRCDVMHPIDVAEDVAICQGYESFTPIMPTHFTVGSLSALELTSDSIRDHMVGMGFQEMFSNILMSHEDLVERMNLIPSDHPVLEVDNVMSLNFSCLRSWILPSLLRIETASSRAFYPHRMFEIGEIAIPNPPLESESKTTIALAALIAHPHANFSEIHTSLDLLLYYLVQDYTLEPTMHRSFLEGRAGTIMVGGQSIGLIGELHPEVLATWHISMPVSAFELNVDPLMLPDVPGSLEPSA